MLNFLPTMLITTGLYTTIEFIKGRVNQRSTSENVKALTRNLVTGIALAAIAQVAGRTAFYVAFTATLIQRVLSKSDNNKDYVKRVSVLVAGAAIGALLAFVASCLR